MNGFGSRALRIFVSIGLIFCGLFLYAAPLRADDAAPADKPPAAPAEEKPVVTLYVDVLSQYIFRGVAYSRDSAVFQPSGTVTYKGFSVNVWGNLDTADHMNNNGSTKWNETDLTASYTHELFWKELNLNVGTIYYSLIPDDTFELYAGLAYTFPWLTLAATGYRDVMAFPGWWLQIDLTRNVPLPWYDMSVDLGASFGYTSADNHDDDFCGWTAGNISAALNIPVGKYFTITPKVAYAFPLASDAETRIQDLSWDGRANHVYGGIRVTATW